MDKLVQLPYFQQLVLMLYFQNPQEDHGQMAAMVHNWPHHDVRVICVTDGSRILGLGDLGANGMGIPIGKLSLYCAAGGIAPHRVLPVVIDAGTDNEELLEDEFYLGVQEKRLKGRDYYKLVDEFMQAVRNRWPNVLVQFEDFSSDKAQVSMCCCVLIVIWTASCLLSSLHIHLYNFMATRLSYIDYFESLP